MHTAGAARVLGHRILSGLIVSPETAKFSLFETIGRPSDSHGRERARRPPRAGGGAVGPAGRAFSLSAVGRRARAHGRPGVRRVARGQQETTRQLLRAGADITVFERAEAPVRHQGARPRASIDRGMPHLAISDVVGDDLGVIGSGPGVPDASRYADAIEALRQFGGLDAYPAAVVERLRAGDRGEVPETLKPWDARAARATAAVIGSRRDAMDGACMAARQLGYEVMCLDRPVVGEARQAAIDYVRDVSERIASREGRVCVVSSGETTVRVTGTGTGGRNQEFALAAASELAGVGPDVVLASVGTDGIDGPTGAAGAMVDRTTIVRAHQLGLDPIDVLRRNDSYAFFEALGDLVVTGRTGTNVGDLQILLVSRSTKGE